MEKGARSRNEPSQRTLGKKVASVVSGSASGAVVSLALQPLDVIRTSLQAQVISNTSGGTRSAIVTAKNIWLNGGLRSFWRGTGPTVWRLSIGLGVQFFILETTKDVFINAKATRYPDSMPDGKQLSSLEAFFTGGLARGIAAAATVPLTIAKTRMEYAGPGGHVYKGTLEALRDIVKTEGVAGLSRGIGPTILTNAPFSALYYMFYTQLKNKLQQDARPRPVVNFAAGSVAAMMATLLTQPTDVVRTQMQLGLAAGLPPTTALAAFKSILARGGPAVLLIGAAPRVLKRTLQTALVWTLYEELQPRLAHFVGKLPA